MRTPSLLLFAATQLTALPTQPSPVTENIQVEQSGSSLDVHTTEERSILNWHSFSIDTHEEVNFQLPHRESAILNRVTGAETSEILGTLQSNGQVYLLNPHGVVIGKDALIDTASFLTSTLCVSDDAFLQNGQLLFEGISDAEIVNLGTIRTQSGDVTLLAHHVEQEGEISAQGELYVGAGHRFLLQPEGSPLLQISPDLPSKGVDLKGNVEALTIKIEADGVHGLGVRQEGSSYSLREENGRTFLSKPNGSISVAADLKASSIQAKGDSLFFSPEAHLTADRISLEAVEGTLYQEGSLLASGGEILLLAHSDDPLYQHGTLDVSGEKAGLISIESPKVLQEGALLADGADGRIMIRAEKEFTAMERALFSTNHDLQGGSQKISAGSIFTSATHRATGKKGGSLHFSAERIFLPAATLDATGKERSGEVRLGEEGVTHTVEVNAFSQLLADDVTIVAWSDAKGKRVEMSAQELLGTAPQLALIDPNPIVSIGFGAVVEALPSGRVIVTNSTSGRLYVYNGSTGALISTLTGVSEGYVTVLSNGNFVTTSPSWNSVGSATWGHGTSGISGSISPSNSIIGSSSGDQVGQAVTALSNGNFVVSSPRWNKERGAVTWGNGLTGSSATGFGSVSSSNSMVGSSINDRVGYVVALTNGNYVIGSPYWSGNNYQAGAATWVNGLTGQSITGFGGLSSANSIIGSRVEDQVSSAGITALSNGNFVVASPYWNNGTAFQAGAATWGNGLTGQSATGFGVVSSSNSIVGSQTNDGVAYGSVFALTNGNFVVSSYSWDGTKGAATWGDGTNGQSATGFGPISSDNSMVGSKAGDFIGVGRITPLTNGNFVIASPYWDRGEIADAGAATWCDGTNGQSATGFGPISVSNSIVGSATGDQIGWGFVTALTNGNFVVSSSRWNSKAGAATWGNGANGQSATGFGSVTSCNSITGSNPNDQVGYSFGDTLSLSNGNFVVSSFHWNGDRGAVTWGNGLTGASATGFGPVTSSNSIVGAKPGDQVGIDATALTNGHFVINSYSWNGTSQTAVGAITWGNGTNGTSSAGIFEEVSEKNSLTGSLSNDQIGHLNLGLHGVVATSDDNYFIISPQWHDSQGAVTWADGSSGKNLLGSFGAISSQDSVVGLGSESGLNFKHLPETPPLSYDPVNHTFIVPFFNERRVIVGKQS